MHSREDDMAVIQAVLQGRQAAYAGLVERYRSYVFTLALRYVQDREVAEELAQDVFVKAYRNLASYRGESKFGTWLYTIVHTTCLSHMRKKGSNMVLPGEEKMTVLQDGLHEDAPTTRQEQRSRQAYIEQAISQLPEVDAQVLSLFYIGERSVEEVARITGMTTTNVKVRLFRARQKLREIIERKYKELV
ncbi:RNA polymerase sigma factor [Nemorincola caseinilytica]|uniref:RNA polymerase sigma factor n=1 Tax=Nemorincola caseinilytica TaxID=2054315 RepID=A0ABP8N7E6_9BACT